MTEDAFVKMRDIGLLFGRTSHDVGRILKHYDFRSEEGKPTQKAFDGQLIREHWSDGFYSWNWHVGRTTALLETFGWMRKSEANTPI